MSMQRTLLVVICFLSGSAALAEPLEPPANPVWRRLVQEGVELGDKGRVRLPPPTLADGLVPAAQRAIVDQAAGRHGWEHFVRDSVVAPFALELRYLDDDQGRRIGHAVSLWFVAYGRLETLTDEQLAEQFIQPHSDPETGFPTKFYEPDETTLARYGVAPAEGAGFEERFAYGEFPLFGRVHVGGVGRAVFSRSSHSLLAAWELDGRFAGDAEMNNRWRPIEIDELGVRRLGSGSSYTGYGGYGKITPLAEPAGALFIECHVVFHEPEAWFDGSNLLRARMPLAIQENVRKFRRQLARAHEAR